MNISDALQFAQRQLPRLDARLLLQAICNVDAVFLISHDNDPLEESQWLTYKIYVDRAAAGEPIPYIVGHAPFYGRDFKVSPHVLIPRPETEQLIEHAITFAAGTKDTNIHIVDAGTGSGCIGITVAAEIGLQLPYLKSRVQITALDISNDALTIAQANARALLTAQQPAVTFLQSDLLTEVTDQISILIANLPYVTADEWLALDPGVRDFEPKLALHGGEDGLDLVGRLLTQSTCKMSKQGLILLEIGWRQGRSAAQLAQTIYPDSSVSILKDYAGHDRIIRIELQ